MGGTPRHKRILLKLSGEALKGEQEFGIAHSKLKGFAREIKEIHDLGIDIAIVPGGGNLFRGRDSGDGLIDRVSADYMGMLATVINSIALQDALESTGLVTRLMSALEVSAVAEPFIRRRAIRHLEKKRVVIFASGTGNPYFSTDTAAALRAVEIKADALLKATLVDGVFSDDPKKVKSAKKFDRISYSDVLRKDLKVIDSTAVTLCRDHHLLIRIFDLNQSGNLYKAVTGSDVGTVISDG